MKKSISKWESVSESGLLAISSLGGGGGDSLIWAVRGRAAGQGMIFWPRCPKQGQGLS